MFQSACSKRGSLDRSAFGGHAGGSSVCPVSNRARWAINDEINRKTVHPPAFDSPKEG